MSSNFTPTNTSSGAENVDPSMISTAQCYAQVNAVWPDYAVMAITFFELASSLEPEFRMLQRVWLRKPHKVNVSELLFSFIQFLLLVGVAGKTANWFSHQPTRLLCRSTAWLQALGFWLSAGLVPIAMSTRAVAVMRSGRSSRKPWLLFGFVCCTHLIFAFTMAFFATKSSFAENGTCVWPVDLVNAMEVLEVWQFPKLWWALWCVVTDLLIGSLTIYKLRQQCGPNGWYHFSRLLFENSVHYMVIMTVANTIQIASFWFPNWSDSTEIVLCLQAIIALRLLSSEQDYVHGHKKSTSASHSGRSGHVRSDNSNSNSTTGRMTPKTGARSQTLAHVETPTAGVSVRNASRPNYVLRINTEVPKGKDVESNSDATTTPIMANDGSMLPRNSSFSTLHKSWSVRGSKGGC